jgi:hypothetical protein
VDRASVDPQLKSRNRLRDIGRLLKDPVASLVEEHWSLQPPPSFDPKIPAGLPSNLLELVQKSLTDGFRESATRLASLLAARRTTDADAVEREALRSDPSEPMELPCNGPAASSTEGVTTSVTT